MRPVEFTCRDVLPLSPQQICAQISRVERWGEFQGYGVVPGIARAEYERRTEDMVGSRIRTRNQDGSSHVEEIVEWRPDRRVVLHMQEFSSPLSRLAERFVEEWDFTVQGGKTHVTRKFSLYPRSAAARVPLWLISLLLRRAVARHLAQMRTPDPAA